MQQFKRSFWQLLFFLTLALSLITFVFIKRPKFQSSLTVTTARVWGYTAPYAHVNLSVFKNDATVKAVFSILNKLFSDKKTAVSLFIHQFLLNEANLAKARFKKTLTYVSRNKNKVNQVFTISNRARTAGLWSREGERAFMNPDFKLSSLQPAQKYQSWLPLLTFLTYATAIFDSDYSKNPKVQGTFNLQKTTTNIYNLFVGWTVEEMKVQLKLKGEQGLQGVKGNNGINGKNGPAGAKGEQGLRGEQGLGTQGDQGLRGPAGQNGQVEKAAVIGLSIALGVVFCLFLAFVMAFYQKRIFSTFKNPQKSIKI